MEGGPVEAQFQPLTQVCEAAVKEEQQDEAVEQQQREEVPPLTAQFREFPVAVIKEVNIKSGTGSTLQLEISNLLPELNGRVRESISAYELSLVERDSEVELDKVRGLVASLARSDVYRRRTSI